MPPLKAPPYYLETAPAGDPAPPPEPPEGLEAAADTEEPEPAEPTPAALPMIRAADPLVLRTVAAGEGVDLTAAAEGDAAPPKFSMTAYTGAAMRLDGYYLPVVVDLEGMRVPRQDLPVLRDHSAGQIVGHTTAVEVTAQRIKAAGVVSGVGDAADEVVRTAKNQYPWQASIGASVERLEFVDRGETVKVNGRSVSGPAYVARAATLVEISFVPMGADGATSATVAAEHKGQPMTFAQWLAARGVADESTLLPGVRAALHSQFEAERNPAPPPAPAPAPVPDPAEQIAAGRRQWAAESARVAGITALRATYGSPSMEVAGENGARRTVGVEAHAIAEGWPVERAELEMLRAARPTAPATRGDTPDPLRALTAETAVCLTAGLRPDRLSAALPAEHRERVMNEAAGSRYRGFGIQSLMDSVLVAAGRPYHGSRKSNDFIRETLAAEQTQIRASQGFSTITLSGILGNVANKAMVQAYETQETTWREIAAVRSHSDFKAVSRYRLDTTGALKKVGQDGELKHVGLTESSYSNQLATYGAMIALTRQMQIDDDLGAFMEVPSGLGQMSALRIEEAVYVTLLSNPSSFFASGNGNLKSGAGSALAEAGLTDAETAFLNQVNSQGKPIRTTPDRLLVPTTLGVTARQLYNDSAIITGSDTTRSSNNPHAGKYRPVVSPYLNNTAIRDQDGVALSGQSATAWYLFANPAVRAAIAVAFLNGQQIPTIESSETEFSTLGMQWRAYLDFGVGMEDTTAAVKNAGA